MFTINPISILLIILYLLRPKVSSQFRGFKVDFVQIIYKHIYKMNVKKEAR